MLSALLNPCRQVDCTPPSCFADRSTDKLPSCSLLAGCEANPWCSERIPSACQLLGWAPWRSSENGAPYSGQAKASSATPTVCSRELEYAGDFELGAAVAPSAVTLSRTHASVEEGRDRRCYAFTFVVPEHAEPGESLRVRAPDGRLVEIVIPPGATPGQKATIEIERRGDEAAPEMQEALDELFRIAKTNCKAMQSTRASLWEELWKELERQKNTWKLEGSQPDDPQLPPKVDAIVSEQMPMSWADLCLQSYMSCSSCSSCAVVVGQSTCFSVEPGKSQRELVLAASTGDAQQLFAAVEQAKKFNEVAPSLEKCCEKLSAADSAMIMWLGLADALQTENWRESQVWIQKAREFGFEATAEVKVALAAKLTAGADVLPQAAPPAQTGPDPARATTGAAASPAEPGEATPQVSYERLGIDSEGAAELLDFVDKLATEENNPKASRSPAANNDIADWSTAWGRQMRPPLPLTRAKCLHQLGLDPLGKPTAAELRTAYRRSAMDCHPDRPQNSERQAEAKALFFKVKEAYEFLNPQQGRRT